MSATTFMLQRRRLLQTAAAACATAPLGVSATADKQGTQSADRVIANWLKTSKEAAQKTIEKYGQPHVAHATHLYWHKSGPLKHEDALEQAIDYKVPPRSPRGRRLTLSQELDK